MQSSLRDVAPHRRGAGPALSRGFTVGRPAAGFGRGEHGIVLSRCGKLKGVKPRALLVAQLVLKLGDGDLDRLHCEPGDVEPCLDRLEARGRYTRHPGETTGVEITRRPIKRALEIIECGLLSGGRFAGPP
jgi:hypothetical protein